MGSSAMTCDKCGGRNSPDATYCRHCFNRVDSGANRVARKKIKPALESSTFASASDTMQCPRCQHANEPASSYCYLCGLPLDEELTLGSASKKIETEPRSSTFASASDTMQCPRCQHANEPASSYCYHCGLPLDEEIISGSKADIKPVPEGEPAGFWIRAGAHTIDSVLVLPLPSRLVYSLFDGIFYSAELYEFDYVVTATVAILYASVLVSLGNTTIGKRVFKLYIVRVDGRRCGFWRAFSRESGKILSILSLGIVSLMIAFRTDKRGLHDLIAGTVVIKKLS